MKMIKKNKTFLCIAACAIPVFLLTACGNSSTESETTSAVQIAKNETESETSTVNVTVSETTQTKTKETTSETDYTDSGNETLVAVFSATGTTKGVAEMIAGITGADLYEITAAQPYTAEDLNHNDPDSRATKEQGDKSLRPEIGSKSIDLSGYSTIYIGYPIWWGEEPRIMDTFVESYDFDGITMIPFCTSGSSPIGDSGKHLEENAGSGIWLEGRRFGGNVSEDELREWIAGN